MISNIISNRNESPVADPWYQSCDIECHPECAGGCNLPNDASQCLDCLNDKLFVSASRFRCVPDCGEKNAAGVGSLTEVQITEAGDDGVPPTFVQTGALSYTAYINEYQSENVTRKSA